MLTLAYKSIMLLFGILLTVDDKAAVYTVAVFLTALILTALNHYLESRSFTVISASAFFVACAVVPGMTPFAPLLCFDLLLCDRRFAAALVFVPIIAFISGQPFTDTALVTLMLALSALMVYACEKLEYLTSENGRVRDAGTELNRILAQKNESLTEKQDYEVHLATLKERNRIAREIHDNVGHILSRSLLQAGALLATNKDENTGVRLSELKNTLSLAMDSIRGSVHNLRDESIDLYDSISKMTEGLSHEIILDYSITSNLPNDVKLCFLSVLKEALTNVYKYSDADEIRITVHEHPALYQFLIRDNGTKKPVSGGDGMGLVNMEERVRALRGQFTAGFQNGFRIFISVPKNTDNGEDAAG